MSELNREIPIRQFRGLEHNLPLLLEGQIGFTTDTKKLFIGSNIGNVEITNKEELDKIIRDLADIVEDIDSIYRDLEGLTGLPIDLISEVLTHVNNKASSSSFGHVKIGENINSDNGEISIPNASKLTTGVVRVGDGLNVVDGVISASNDSLNMHKNSDNASTTQKGHVQLTSALNSDSEVLGATAKAIKDVNTTVTSKYTKPSSGIPKTDLATNVQNSIDKIDNVESGLSSHLNLNASTTQKGHVQLTSALNSDSEVLGATAKAIKDVNTTVTSLQSDITSERDRQNYATFAGSLKSINYNAKVYADSTTTDRPTTSTSYFVDVIVRGDNANYRTLVARATNGVDSYILRMNNGIWSTWVEDKDAVKTLINNKYTKPSGGIPKSDLTTDLQISIDSISNKYTKPTNGIPKTDLTTELQTSINKIESVENKLINYATATGTNLLSISLSNVYLSTGLHITFKVATTNTSAVTLNFNGNGAKNVLKSGNEPLTAGELKAGGVYTVVYDGVNFILTSGGGSTANLSNIQNDEVTIYVSNNGLDSNNGLSSGTPVKTIAKAVQLIKNLGAKKRTIQLAGGETFNEPVILEEMHGGVVEINGTYNNNATVKGFQFEHCSSEIRILHVNVRVTGTITGTISYGLHAQYCRFVSVWMGLWEGITFGVYLMSTNARVESTVFNNILGTVVEGNYGSYVYVSGLSGTSTASTANTYYASASIIIGQAGTVTAPRGQGKVYGGQIFFTT